MTTDTTHTISRAARQFASGTMLSRVSGMLRDVVMAWAFGVHEAVAALMMAYRFAHLLRRVFGEGAMQSAFIPHFERLRADDPARAGMFFRDLTASVALLLTAVVAVTVGVIGWWLWQGDPSPSSRQVLLLLALMMPSLLFICLFGLNMGHLQCDRDYITPSIAPVAFNALWIAAAAMLAWQAPERAMPWLATGVTVACVAQWMITLRP